MKENKRKQKAASQQQNFNIADQQHTQMLESLNSATASPVKVNDNGDLARVASPAERIHFSKDIKVLENVDLQKKKLIKGGIKAKAKDQFTCANKSFLVLPRYMALLDILNENDFTSFTLKNCKVSTSKLTEMIKHLPMCLQLSLSEISGPKHLSTKLFSFICETIPHLTDLKIEHTAIQQLKFSKNLMNLTLVNVGPITAIQFKKFYSLKNLKINSCQLGIQHAMNLATCLLENKKLQTLDLTNNLLKSSGAKLILEAASGHKALTSVFLGSNFICNEGACYIADYLISPGSSRLKDLHLESNMINALGLNAIFQSLAITNRSLKYLDISDNFITVEALHSLRNMIVKNTTLHYLVASDLHKFNKEAREQIQKGLQSNTGLKSINLTICTQQVFDEFSRNVPARIKVIAENIIVGRTSYRKKMSQSVDKNQSYDDRYGFSDQFETEFEDNRSLDPQPNERTATFEIGTQPINIIEGANLKKSKERKVIRKKRSSMVREQSLPKSVTFKSSSRTGGTNQTSSISMIQPFNGGQVNARIQEKNKLKRNKMKSATAQSEQQINIVGGLDQIGLKYNSPIKKHPRINHASVGQIEYFDSDSSPQSTLRHPRQLSPVQKKHYSPTSSFSRSTSPISKQRKSPYKPTQQFNNNVNVARNTHKNSGKQQKRQNSRERFAPPLNRFVGQHRESIESFGGHQNNGSHAGNGDLSTVNESFRLTQAEKDLVKYKLQNDNVVGFYKKVLGDIKTVLASERKEVQKFLKQ